MRVDIASRERWEVLFEPFGLIYAGFARPGNLVPPGLKATCYSSWLSFLKSSDLMTMQWNMSTPTKTNSPWSVYGLVNDRVFIVSLLAEIEARGLN